MSNFHKTFGDFDTHLMVGTSTENTETNTQNHWGYNFITAGTTSVNNIGLENKFFTDATGRKRLVGVLVNWVYLIKILSISPQPSAMIGRPHYLWNLP
jgi:hypothetical protein